MENRVILLFPVGRPEMTERLGHLRRHLSRMRGQPSKHTEEPGRICTNTQGSITLGGPGPRSLVRQEHAVSGRQVGINS